MEGREESGRLTHKQSRNAENGGLRSSAAAITAKPSSGVRVREATWTSATLASAVRLIVREGSGFWTCCDDDGSGVSPQITSAAIARLVLNRIPAIMMPFSGAAPVTAVLRHLEPVTNKVHNALPGKGKVMKNKI